MPLSKERDRVRKRRERAKIRLDKLLSTPQGIKPVQPKLRGEIEARVRSGVIRDLKRLKPVKMYMAGVEIATEVDSVSVEDIIKLRDCLDDADIPKDNRHLVDADGNVIPEY